MRELGTETDCAKSNFNLEFISGDGEEKGGRGDLQRHLESEQ